MKNVILFTLLAMLAVGCGRPQDGRNGVDGQPGAPGAPGQDGHVSLLTLVSGAPTCANGGTTILAGIDLDDDLVLAGEEVRQSSEICNGLNGQDGANGQDGQDGADGQDAPPTPFTPVGLVNPCGDAPGIYDEVFIRLSNGTMIASFSENSNGKNTRFSVLIAGTYVTTDGDNCQFTVDSMGNITNESKNY